MQTIEKKYGIPTFDTCKKISEYWKEETLFTMYEFKNTLAFIESASNDIIWIDNKYKAPQIHEFLELLPNTITYENYFYDLEMRKNCVFYSCFDRNIFEFENDNLAECLAQLYLTLKEKELL